MTQQEIDEFRAYCEHCLEEVMTWPEWKRSSLGPWPDVVKEDVE